MRDIFGEAIKYEYIPIKMEANSQENYISVKYIPGFFLTQIIEALSH
jgi:hypothetical protein